MKPLTATICIIILGACLTTGCDLYQKSEIELIKRPEAGQSVIPGPWIPDGNNSDSTIMGN